MSWVRARLRQVKAAVEKRKGTWVQDALALVTVGAVVYLAVTGQPVPEVLSGIAWLIIGFFFGSNKRPEVPVAGEEVAPAALQRTRHGRGRERVVHMRCVHPAREAGE